MHKSILIWGFASSGKASLNFLFNKRNKFFIFDKNKEVQEEITQKYSNVSNVFVLNAINKDVIDGMDLIVISPSVSIFDKNISYAKALGKEVVSELELGAREFSGKLVAITGTNGKTTTTQLVGNVLRVAGKRFELVGNIGVPICSKVKHSRGKIFVCETSSFQLEAVKTFHPHIACLLNISADHLDRHKTMENYADMKYRIFAKQHRRDFAVVQFGLSTGQINSKIFSFGFERLQNGCYVSQNKIWFDKNGKAEFVCNVSDVSLVGKHNLENVMACIVICKLLKIKNKHIVAGIKTFHPDNHRLQLAKTCGNVRFFDDSKATNIDAVRVAIDAMDKERNIVLLLGGSDKGLSCRSILEHLPKNVVQVIAFGALAEAISSEARELGLNNISSHGSLKDAVFEACGGDNCDVLLSPGSASYDEFANYAERGNKFLEYVEEYYSQLTNNNDLKNNNH